MHTRDEDFAIDFLDVGAIRGSRDRLVADGALQREYLGGKDYALRSAFPLHEFPDVVDVLVSTRHRRHQLAIDVFAVVYVVCHTPSIPASTSFWLLFWEIFS